MKTFRRLNPGSDWDHLAVESKKDHVYIIRFMKGTKCIHQQQVCKLFKDLLREIEACGCCISKYRQYLPPTHMDIGT